MTRPGRSELPLDRLSTTDEKGRRVWLYPADVRGRFRDLRVKVRAVLIVLLLALPWIEIGGHQAILIDVHRRRFSLFGLTFWAHDAPMLFFVFGGTVLALCFVTAVWGRAWCGWACPQTVFIDGVYRRIERWIEGDSVQRKRLNEAPWDAVKVLRKSVKWALFSGVSILVAHTFLAYFVGTERLLEMIRSKPDENPASFAIMAGATLVTLFDFGWFREQFCTVVCPYGRFQSVLMDDFSKVIAYQGARGEPRRGIAAVGAQKQGDCVDCFRCVQVCPTGIDIRRGVQLECIACTACIDACDDVMTRLKKPKGLIRYDSASAANGSAWSRPRLWIYLALLAALMAGLAANLVDRAPLTATIFRAAEAPYQLGASDEVINHFKLDLGNQSFEAIDARIGLAPEAESRGLKLVAPLAIVPVEPGKSRRADFFVKAPRSYFSNGRGAAAIRVAYRAANPGKDHVIEEELKLVGPIR